MRILISILFCLMTIVAQSQTYYYAHTKTVYADGRTVVESGNSGQFVTRQTVDRLKKCFDSTSSGLDHLNGSLFFSGMNNGNEVYKGKCYYGPNCSYQFNDSKGLLNIKDAKGNIYVYKRQQPPVGRTRSSLLISGASENGYDWTDPYVPEDDVKNDNDRDKKVRNDNSTDSSRRCGYCHGNGRVRAHVGVSGFGVSNKKNHCSVCGKDYYASENHWHTCPQCHGTGRK